MYQKTTLNGWFFVDILASDPYNPQVMIEAKHAAFKARQIGNEDLAKAFEAAYDEAKRKGVLSLAIERFRHNVADKTEIVPGTDLAGIQLGLRAFDFGRNRLAPDKLGENNVATYIDADGSEVQAYHVNLRDADEYPDFPTHLAMLVQNPGTNLDLIRQVKTRFKALETEALKAAWERPFAREDFEFYLKTGIHHEWTEGELMVDARPGMYICVDPLSPGDFGRVEFPSFVRTEKGIMISAPTEANFTKRTNLESQQYASALLDAVEG